MHARWKNMLPSLPENCRIWLCPVLALSVPSTFLKEAQIEHYEISVDGSDCMEQNSPWIEGTGSEAPRKCGM
jgi:hypothetical protein